MISLSVLPEQVNPKEFNQEIKIMKAGKGPKLRWQIIKSLKRPKIHSVFS
jgi:hypothetical protein